MYEIGAWKVKVPEDIEIYSSDKRTAELIPHSQYGYRFREDSSKEANMTADTKILVPETPAHYNRVQRSFTNLGVRYTPVTVHTSAGAVQAFRVSTAASYVLATLKLINSN